ncbi:MAG: hypothetical protein DCO96_15855 [Fluviicola sp. XM-24bin1]|nr:MAG: hypothetical protein DCO96_15855 [Fluviicola sp. XM-24bin1]
MELVYVYVEDYLGIIKDHEYNLSTEHRFTYDSINGTLSKLHGTPLPNNFYGSKIENLTCIIGENGSGKSSFFKALIKEFTSDFRTDQKLFTIWWNGTEYECFGHEKFENTLGFSVKQDLRDIHVVSYYPFESESIKDPYSYYDALNYSNISTGAIKMTTYKEHSKLQRIGNEKWVDVENVFEVYEIERKLNFLTEDKTSIIPACESIVLGIMDIESILKSRKDKSYDAEIKGMLGPLAVRPGLKSEEEYIKVIETTYYRYIMAYFLLEMSQQLSDDSKEGEEYDEIKEELAKIDEWQNFTSSEIISALKIWKDSKERYLADAASNTLSILLEHITGFIDSSKEYLLEIAKKNPSSTLAFLKVPFKNSKDRVLDFFNLYFNTYNHFRLFKIDWEGAINSDGAPTHFSFSTGEMHYLKLFSRLHEVISTKFNNLQKDEEKLVLMFLDESEIALHPRWQQNFIKWLTDFLNKQSVKGLKFQVLLATHSPIMLSDMPKGNVVRLFKSDTKIANLELDTFGGSIHKMLSNSFFVDKSLMGLFAKGKIKDASELLNRKGKLKSDKIDELEKFISIVDEPVIKDRMRFLLQKKKGEQTIEDQLIKEQKENEKLRREIEELRNKKKGKK